MAKTIEELHLKVHQIISIGGWNAPHPNTDFSAEVWWESWKKWNQEVVARPSLNFHGFEGFDWDIEGNDKVSSEYNVFTVECLDLMGRLSQLAKHEGYIVAIMPPQREKRSLPSIT
jgi:hypothetical protein